MVSRQLQRRLALRRKLHILRSLSCSKSVIRERSIIMDTLVYIYKLKLKLEAIKRELSSLMAVKRQYLNLVKQHMDVPKEVKVEKVEKGFLVRVRCKKGKDMFVSILEAFEEMGLVVLQARVSCNFYFAMEAIAAADNDDDDHHQVLETRDIAQSIRKAIERQGEEGT